MKPRLFFWTVGLVAALLAVSCAPSATNETTPPEVSDLGETVATEAIAPTVAPTAQIESPTIAVELPPFTPHGKDLVATDPTTVTLASGGLQLVEFFRFT
ncbi:MAG: hypothetical protein ACKOBL_17305 [Chloroflexota bacterium]|jgi:hypothetical protein